MVRNSSTCVYVFIYDLAVKNLNHKHVSNVNILVLQSHINMKKHTELQKFQMTRSFSHLVTLRHVDCEYCFSMPALAQLPSLRRLETDGLNGVELFLFSYCVLRWFYYTTVC
ncbi:hypothetical protein DVH24_033049 [Malus domestica]|uniref:Uncharacterized protein n=1 Tax=Malus domestica TaxID=3750 RepID=A0A498IRI8_MALDO|nr:hypothetical protein DVH24_033049 [Malus domestica]